MTDGSGAMLPGPALFLPMWALMMAAMMLPATGPVAALYGRLAPGPPRRGRVAGFVAGYLSVWVLAGLPGFRPSEFEIFGLRQPMEGQAPASPASQSSALQFELRT